MNKYQEALDRIGRNYYLSEESGDFEHFENLYLENKKILQELVERATPKKAVWIEDFLRCPSCLNYDSLSDGYGEHHNYCNDCGQALDWSKDEI